MQHLFQLDSNLPSDTQKLVTHSKIRLPHYLKFIQYLVDKNGPDPEDFEATNQVIFELVEAAKNSEITFEEMAHIRAIFGEVLSVKALFGFVLQKPHGYAGDYEIIDKIYTRHESSDFRFTKWDHYFQVLFATEAVRNRSQYFCQLLNKKK